MFFGEIYDSIRGRIDCRQKIKPKSDRLLAWISTDWNSSNAGFGKGFRRLGISALSVIRYGELITRVHAVSFARPTILGESGAPRFRCMNLRRMPALWRSQVS